MQLYRGQVRKQDVFGAPEKHDIVILTRLHLF